MRLLTTLLLTTAALGCPDPGDAPPTELPPSAAILAPEETLSPNAGVETAEAMRRDLETPRHPADGGGRSWLEAAWAFDGPPGSEPTPLSETVRLTAGGRGRFDLVYEAGPLGILEGGLLLLQVSPFWEWDTPQTEVADAPGFTVVATDAAGVELRPRTLAETLLGIEIAGRALAAGEQVRVRFGAGPQGARVDRYAEREARIWFAVDGDGDGVRALVSESPRIDIYAGPAARLVVIAPTTARTGDTLSLRISVLDRQGNRGIPFEGEVALRAEPGLELPERVTFTREHAGVRSVEMRATQQGIYRISASSEDFETRSNPLVVDDTGPRVLWGDLHGHSNLSDGTGTPEDFLAYAREVAGLDVVALTDHDHWGMQFLDTTPALWERIGTATRNAHRPGSFVTLLGFEWTSWLHGHRHVLYFEDGGEVISSIDPATENPAQLWAALEGRPALTFAHHSAGAPVATNWNFVPDPVLEPVTEIVSVHGSSEAPDSPGGIHSPVPGNFVRDALDHGYELGLIGSGDSHDGHPGLVWIAASGAVGGLAAIISEEATREGVLAALRKRRVYATNGPRILLRASLDGAPMGSRISTSRPGDSHALEIAVVAASTIERVDLIRGGRSKGQVKAMPLPEAPMEWSQRLHIPKLAAGEYLYVRVVQHNGGIAWSSPFFGRP